MMDIHKMVLGNLSGDIFMWNQLREAYRRSVSMEGSLDLGYQPLRQGAQQRNQANRNQANRNQANQQQARNPAQVGPGIRGHNPVNQADDEQGGLTTLTSAQQRQAQAVLAAQQRMREARRAQQLREQLRNATEVGQEAGTGAQQNGTQHSGTQSQEGTVYQRLNDTAEHVNNQIDAVQSFFLGRFLRVVGQVTVDVCSRLNAASIH